MKSLKLTAVAVLAATAVVVPAGTASAKPDTECMQAGIAELKARGALPGVAKGGLPIDLALALGVTAREGTVVEDLPDPLPLSVVLADHRAGADSLFVYPWC